VNRSTRDVIIVGARCAGSSPALLDWSARVVQVMTPSGAVAPSD